VDETNFGLHQIGCRYQIAVLVGNDGEISRLHAKQLVGAVIADVKRLTDDDRVVDKAGPGQRNFLTLLDLEIEHPDGINIGHPRPVAFDEISYRLIDHSAFSGQESCVEDFSVERELGDFAFAVFVGRLEAGPKSLAWKTFLRAS
jgi:hypothetical protein